MYLILGTPFLVWGGFRAPSVTPKVVAFQILVEIALASCLLWLLASRPAGRIFKTLTPPTLTLAVAVFLGYAFVSACLGTDFRTSLWGFIERQDGLVLLAHLLAWILVFHWLHGGGREDWWPRLATAGERAAQPGWWHAFQPVRYVNTSFWIAVAVAALALVTRMQRQLGGVDVGSLENADAGGVGGVFGNPMALGPYLLFHFFYGLAYWKSARLPAAIIAHSRPRKKHAGSPKPVLIAAALLLILAVLFLGQTRGVLFGLSLGMLSMALLALCGRSIPRPAKLSVMVIVLIAVLSGAGLWHFRESGFVKTNSTLYRLTHISPTENETTRMRLMVWKSALRGFRDHPVTGYGHDNVYYALNRYYNPEHVSFSVDFSRPDVTWYDKSHNAYVDLLVEKGAIGACLFLALCAVLVRALVKLKDRFLAICLAGAFVAYGFANFVAFDSYGSLLALFLILAWLASAAWPGSAGVQPPEGSTKSLKGKRTATSAPPWGTRQFAGATAILLLLAVGLVWNAGVARADAGYQEARMVFGRDAWLGLNLYQEAFRHSSPYAAKEKLNCAYLIVNGLILKRLEDPRGAHREYALSLAREAAEAFPEDAAVFMVLNDIYNGLGAYLDRKFLADAQKAGERALELSPTRQEVMFNLGRTYLLSEQPARAVELNRRMIRQFPDLPIAHWLLGLSLLGADQREEAKQEITQALKTGYTFQKPEEREAIRQIFSEAELNELVGRKD